MTLKNKKAGFFKTPKFVSIYQLNSGTMVAQPTIKIPLNDTQLMLLKLFSRPMNPGDLESIRNMLLDYYETLLQKEVDQVIEEKGITRADFDRVLSNDQRAK